MSDKDQETNVGIIGTGEVCTDSRIDWSQLLLPPSPVNWGTVPRYSRCPANNRGGEPELDTHLTDATHPILAFQNNPESPMIEYFPCRLCGALFGRAKS